MGFAPFTEFFASDNAIYAQLLTFLAVAITAYFWYFAHGKLKIDLKPFSLPIILWFVFGSLDIMITARGVFGEPGREGNPLAKNIFLSVGPIIGPPLASILWITLWAVVAIALYYASKKLQREWIADARYAIFYSLAVGHFFGFMSWMAFGQGIRNAWRALDKQVWFFDIGILAGVLLAIAHIFIARHLLKKAR